MIPTVVIDVVSFADTLELAIAFPVPVPFKVKKYVIGEVPDCVFQTPYSI